MVNRSKVKVIELRPEMSHIIIDICPYTHKWISMHNPVLLAEPHAHRQLYLNKMLAKLLGKVSKLELGLTNKLM